MNNLSPHQKFHRPYVRAGVSLRAYVRAMGRGEEEEREREREGTNIICIISNRIKESARRNEIARICQTHLLSLLEAYVATLTYPRTQTIKAFRKCRPCYRDIEMSIAIEISDSSNGNRTNRTSSMRTRTIEEQRCRARNPSLQPTPTRERLTKYDRSGIHAGAVNRIAQAIARDLYR